MDHGNGIPVAEEQAFQKRKQSSWIPITPMKQEHGSRLTGRHLMSMDSVERMPCQRDLDNSMEMEQQPTENIMLDWGKNMPFLQLLARTDAASAATTIHRDRHPAVRPFTPLMNTHIYNGSSSSQQQSSSTALLLQQINPNLLLQKPQNVLAPYLTNYNLDSSQNVATVVSNGTISFQLEHGMSTLGALLKSQSAAPIDFDREVNEPKEDSYRVANQGKQLKKFVSNQVSAQPEDPTQSVLSSPVTVSDGLPHPINPSVALSTSVEENNNFTKGDDKGIDLNKTPQTKSRRKKHRPKVMREGKPKRIPKPVKPKQPSNKENPSGKRKYVRKTGPKASKAPFSDIEKAIHLERAETKPCRRSLNFNLDEQAEDTRPNMAPAQERPNDSDVNVTRTTASCTSNSSYQDKSQTQEFAGANPNLGSILTKELGPGVEIVCNSPGSKLILQHTPGQEMVVENSWTEFEFDLCSFTQEDYVLSPENSNPSTPIRKEKIKNKSIGTCAYKNKESSHAPPPYTHAMETACINNTHEAVCNKHEGRARSGLQDDIQAAIKSQSNLNNKTQKLLAETICARKETKRKNSHSANDSHVHSLNLNETNKLSYISSHSNNGDLCFHIHKKKRTVTKHGRFPSNASNVSSLTAQHDHTRQVTSSTLNKDTAKHLCSAVDQIAQNTLEEALSSINGGNEGLENNRSKALEADGFLGLGQIMRRIKKKWNGSFEIRTLPTIAIATGHEEKSDTSRRMAPTSDYRKANNTCPGTQPYMEALVADNNAVMKRKKRSKGTEACRLYSLSSPNTNYVHQEDQTAAYDNRRSLVESRGTALNRSSRFQETSVLSLSSLVLYKDPVEEIIQKFIMLNISGDSNSNMAGMLVHYVGDRTIVPYEPFQPTKKRRPRAKVDLDPETDRVWKLLMWNEGSDAAEERDAEKEKWWAEERRNFQGRAESFIARMHLVQGDRRFSKWKGSVVDSVIGVFLTQNVSDHLSSSAFMALAARFPVRSNDRKGTDGEGTSTAAEEQEACILDSDGNIQQDNRECEGCRSLDEAEPMEKQIMNLNELSESNIGCSTECTKEMCRESPESGIGTSATVTDNASLTDVEDRQGLEEAASSQVSVLSSENSLDSTIHLAEQLGTSSGSNLEGEYLMTGFKCDDREGSPSFTKLLQMAGSNMFQEFQSHKNEMGPFKQILQSVPNQLKHTEFEKRNSSIKGTSLSDSCAQIDVPNSCCPQAIEECKGMSGITYSDYQLHSSQGSSGSVDLAFTDASGDESRCSLPSNTCETVETNDIYSTGKGTSLGMENLIEFMGQKNQIPSDPIATATDSCAEKRKNLVDASSPAERTGAPLNNDTSNACSQPHMTVNILCKPRERNLEPEVNEAVGHSYLTEELLQNQNSELHKHLGDTSDVAESSSLMGEHKFIERMEVVLNSKDEVHGSRSLTETTEKTSKLKKEGNSSAKKCENVNWDSLRKQACSDGLKKERSSDRMDSLDWEAVRCAEVGEIANTIRERGMNNRLAERINDFLNRVVRDHGSIDLEWLRDVPPDKVKEYLLSIRGLGLKSVECIRLLTLHHLAFPVDTNVGRICVRLGWVPLQPLPESLQLHLLEMYPVLDSIQKYLWPRLCTLDQRTLYELHYQMITFGKVFCTKSKPNCNACPMRAECRHFASAFASARLALPGPEEKSIVSSAFHMTAEEHPKPVINLLPLPPMQGLPSPQVESEIKRCEPIIEEPTTPEHESIEASENEIEDAFWKEDPDEIPTIKLNFEEFTTNIQNYIQQNNIEMQDGDMSKALVSLTPEAASIPGPKLKNMSRLRTEHQVYELPDTHPLLIGLDKREPDDPCSYLLAIWTPGETAQSTQPPEICCNSQASGILCDKMTCFACNSVREAESQTVRGTLLIPCRTAMRGSFPLNGTYFQVNEVFADHDSSLNPIDVPRAWIWNLPRRTVYFGTSIPTIFRGLTTEGIQHCFWRGFVCIRGFDQKTRAPRPLIARLHFPASKLVKTRKKPIKPERPMQTATSMKS